MLLCNYNFRNKCWFYSSNCNVCRL